MNNFMLSGWPDAGKSEAEDDEEAEDRDSSGAPGGGQEAHHPLGHIRLRLGLCTLIDKQLYVLQYPHCNADPGCNWLFVF